MDVEQEPLDDKTGNNSFDKKEENSLSNNSGEGTTPPISSPREIEVEVNPNAKPAVLKEKVNLLTDDDVDTQMTQPTEEDIKQKQKEKISQGNDIDGFRQEKIDFPPNPTSTSPAVENRVVDKDKLKRKAEKWAKALDKGAVSLAKIWSGQADNTGFVVQTKDVDDVAEAIFDVFEEYNVDKYLSPIVTLGATLYAVYAPVYSNAKASKKKIDAFKEAQRRKNKPAEEIPKMKPDFDPAKRKHIKNKGGQAKA